MRHPFAPIAAVLLIVGVPGAFLSGVAAPGDAPEAATVPPASFATARAAPVSLPAAAARLSLPLPLPLRAAA